MIRRLLSYITSRTDRAGGKPVTVTDEYHIWDSEDHGTEPTVAERRIIDQLRAARAIQITPEMRERAMARYQAEVEQARVRRVLAQVAVDTRPPFPGCGCEPGPADSERTPPLTADELDAEIAAYEAAAAERARRAGVAWPANPATVGIARYDDKAGQR